MMTRNSIEDVYIAVTGVTGAGKSEFIRLCTGKDVVVGNDLHSQTSEVEDWTFMFNPRIRVHLIDTPGFEDTNKKDVEILREIASWLVATAIRGVLLSGLVYLHPVTDNRLRGSALRNLHMFKRLCGNDCLSSVVLVTTMWDIVSPDLGRQREDQLRSEEGFWGGMERRGCRVMQHTRTQRSAMQILGAIVKNRHPQMLRIQEEMLLENKGLENTFAGMKVHEDLVKARQDHMEELAALKKDMEDADQESKSEIEKLMREQKQQMSLNEQDRRKLEIDMERLEAERAREMQLLQAKLQDQVDSLQLKDAKMQALQKRCEDWDAQSTIDLAEKNRLREELEQMRHDQDEERRKFTEDYEKASRRSTDPDPFGDVIRFFVRLFGGTV